tara:strand:+ start:222 stop:464 length:243 start_codon:yes stop_codon:yes gene_type:complete
MFTPTQNPAHTPVHTLAQTPPQADWGELGAPPPPPVLIRQNAFDLFNVARRLDFDSDSDDDDENDSGFPLPLVGIQGNNR